MAIKNATKIQKKQEQHELFGQLAVFVGLGAVIASLWFNTVIPIVLAIVGLFGTLAFMNGLS